jgi:hypothetical protein
MTRNLAIFVVQESKGPLHFTQKLHRSGFYSLRAANRKVAGACLFLSRPMETGKSMVCRPRFLALVTAGVGDLRDFRIDMRSGSPCQEP